MCTKEPCISRKNQGDIKEKKLPARKKVALELLEKQKGQVKIKMSGDNGYPFIATLHNVILA